MSGYSTHAAARRDAHAALATAGTSPGLPERAIICA